jgi:hypothetical protein
MVIMANRKKQKDTRSNQRVLISSAHGAYDQTDYRTDQAILDQMRSQGGLTPRTEAQMQRIIERMQRRSWD